MDLDIPNWFDFPPFYKELAMLMPEGSTFVEVGAWVGHSISFFANEIKNLGKKNCRIVAIDNFKGAPNEQLQMEIAKIEGGGFRRLFDNTLTQAGVIDMVEVIEGDSVTSANNFEDNSIWGVFIDADHSTEAVIRDIKTWAPKIIQGGILSGHDINEPSVNQAVSSCVKYTAKGRCWQAI